MLRKYYFTSYFSKMVTTKEFPFVIIATSSVEWSTTIMGNTRITLFLN